MVTQKIIELLALCSVLIDSVNEEMVSQKIIELVFVFSLD